MIDLQIQDQSLALRQQAASFEEVLSTLKDFKVECPEDLTFAETERAEAKAQLKVYEEQRTSVVKPLNTVVKTINAWFKPVTDALSNLERAWSQKILEARAEAEAKQRALIEAAQAAEQPLERQEALVAAAAVQFEPEAVTFQDHWVFEVVDPTAVPREFLCPDLRAIGEVVKAQKGATNIPGVVVRNEPIVKSRPGKH